MDIAEAVKRWESRPWWRRIFRWFRIRREPRVTVVVPRLNEVPTPGPERLPGTVEEVI